MRFVQALYWLRDILDSDNGQILQRLRAILTDPVHGDSIRDDLRLGLPTLPIWMQSIVRQLLETRPRAAATTRRPQARRGERSV